MSHRFTFPKAEHLCLKRDIERLFSAGTKSLSAYPLRVVVGAAETGSVPVKVLMSVSKRFFLRLASVLMARPMRPVTRMLLPDLYGEAPELERFRQRW